MRGLLLNDVSQSVLPVASVLQALASLRAALHNLTKESRTLRANHDK